MPAERKAKGFFCVDRGAFRCAAAGGLNSAIAYLVMARGTGPDNRTTQWSVNAIEKHTGISRPNAKRAVEDLLDRGIWKKTREGNHPIYEAVPGNEIPGGPFTAIEQKVVAAIRDGEPIPRDAKAFEALSAKGFIHGTGGGGCKQTLKVDEEVVTALAEPVPVWLPNALVDGAADEVPPIELVRQTRSLPALRLLVEFYEVQFLPIFGGIPRSLLRVEFDRLRVGERGPFMVWGFRKEHLVASYSLARPFFTGQTERLDDGTHEDEGWDASFWPAVDALRTLGLVVPVGMLLDGDDPEAEIIHPYGVNGGEAAERELAHVAHEAAVAMMSDEQLWRAEVEGYPHLVPVRKHIAKAPLVEIFRLRYRPHTSATAAWYAQMKESVAEWLARYDAILTDRANRESAA
jgi:hypothetical protein